MHCIIVEDEPAAQSILEQHIAVCAGLNCCGIFREAFTAQEYLDDHPVDLIFLDINLPGMSGVSFLRSLLHPPMVIFTTAYPQYAIDGFDLEIVDFLLKPISFERFCKAVNKAKERFNKKDNPVLPETITVRSDKKIYRIRIDEIAFIETCGDYVTIHYAGKKLLVHGTLKNWEEKLSGYSFLKVHRTTIVNLQKIEHVEGNIIVTAGHQVPLAEPFRALLFEKIFN
jgi:DNA-binding LytR/AlgR family response regulator